MTVPIFTMFVEVWLTGAAFSEFVEVIVVRSISKDGLSYPLQIL